MDQGTYREVEAEGREWLESRARKYHSSATARPERHRRAKARDEELARVYALRAADSTRWLWSISIGGYGTLYWVGTRASADGRRVLKVRWEGAHSSRIEKIRPARADEADGDAERPAELPADALDARGRVYFHATDARCPGSLVCTKDCGGTWVHASS